MLRRLSALLCLAALAPWSAAAHTLMPTLVLVSFGQPGAVDIKIDADLLLLLGSPERYYQFATEPAARQQADAQTIARRLSANLQLRVGSEALQPRLILRANALDIVLQRIIRASIDADRVLHAHALDRFQRIGLFLKQPVVAGHHA